MEIAGDMCVYTNHNLIVENIEPTIVTDTETETPVTTVERGSESDTHTDAAGNTGATTDGAN